MNCKAVVALYMKCIKDSIKGDVALFKETAGDKLTKMLTLY
jgi:hypothetical protein